MLTPLDIQNAAFHRSFRGYNEQEVDDFLDRVFLEYEQLYRENLELKEQLEKLKAAPSSPAHDLAHLRAAQAATADYEEALRQSSEIIADAKLRAEEMIAQAQQAVAREKKRLEELKQQRRMFKEQFKAMLQTFFHILKESEDELVTDSTIVMRAQVSAGSEEKEQA
ncbi:MAG: DivIVA domain-containing protein [Firmicutes bacterium]|nr:DivIVA domain-containing protein [Bacillota bacterium]